MEKSRRRLDLQAKITLILLAVLLPTFLIVTLAQTSLTEPLLREEMKQVGITTAKTLASEIVSERLMSRADPVSALERKIQEFAYSRPSIIRIDVAIRDPFTGMARTIASNVEEFPGEMLPMIDLVEAVSSEFKLDPETKVATWEVSAPIEQKTRDGKGSKRLLGTVRAVVSLDLVTRVAGTVWKITTIAAGISLVVLLLVLSYFLRKTISNERLLRRAETANLQLTAQLHEAQRQLMNTEKLAVMGQLTASFAHEIGTPLNAIGGHLQLLGEEISGPSRSRLEIIHGQLEKIAQIVKGFLQSTANPPSQRQLVDVNQLLEKTLRLVMPRTRSEGVEVRKDLDRSMGPLRVVPLEMEQIFLNLFNNSMDSMQSKIEARTGRNQRLSLEISTQTVSKLGKEWAEIAVYDTGEGIRKADLPNVRKPFFTTKGAGRGTGLGLTICQQLVQKYGGELEIDSKEGAWTRVCVRIPYQLNA